MAHTYVVTSNTAVGDLATLVGTVDGIAVSVSYWVSHVQPMTNANAKNFIAALMLAQAIPSAPITVAQLPVGTFTQ